MSAPAVTTIVITDTNVLINFLHIGQLALLGEDDGLAGYPSYSGVIGTGDGLSPLTAAITGLHKVLFTRHNMLAALSAPSSS